MALGGYGRGMLAPGSDVDLLILHDGRARRRWRGLAERFLYPLWDAGLRVGHAVRTPDECVERRGRTARRRDGDAGRPAGRRGRVGWSTSCVRRAGARGATHPRGFAPLVEDLDARRERYGSVSRCWSRTLKEGDGRAPGRPRARAGSGARDRPTAGGGGHPARGRNGEAVDGAEEFLDAGPERAAPGDAVGASDRLVARAAAGDRRGDGVRRRAGTAGGRRADAGGVRARRAQVEHVAASAFDRYLRGTGAAAPARADARGDPARVRRRSRERAA